MSAPFRLDGVVNDCFIEIEPAYLSLAHTHTLSLTHTHTHTHTHLVSRELKCEEVCREDFCQIAGNFAHGLHELKGLKRRQEIEQGRCGECGGGGLVGKVDPSDGNFYCDACWEQFAGGVGGGPPLPPPSSCHRGGVGRGGYEGAHPVSAWQKEEKNKAHDSAPIDEEARCAQFPCQSWGSCLYFHSYLTDLKMCQALLRKALALSLQESGGPGGGSSSGWGGEGGQGKVLFESVMESLVMMGFARSADTGRHT